MKGLEPPASCSQSRRATNCATPRFYYIFYPVDFFCFLRNVRCASLKNIVVLLAWSASHYSLFFHLRASPVSSPGRGEPLRPTALHPDFIIFYPVDFFCFLRNVRCTAFRFNAFTARIIINYCTRFVKQKSGSAHRCRPKIQLKQAALYYQCREHDRNH